MFHRTTRPCCWSRDDNRPRYLVRRRVACRLTAIRGAGLLALSPAATAKLVEVLRYEQLFYFYMGGNGGPGSLSDLCGFQRVMLNNVGSKQLPISLSLPSQGLRVLRSRRPLGAARLPWVAGINLASTAANVTTLLAGPATRLALPDRDPDQQPLTAATAEFAGSRSLTAASRIQNIALPRTSLRVTQKLQSALVVIYAYEWPDDTDAEWPFDGWRPKAATPKSLDNLWPG
jgi:hypothetical protein